MSARTLSSNHSQRADSGGRRSFMPLTARSASLMGARWRLAAAPLRCPPRRRAPPWGGPAAARLSPSSAESLLDVALDQRVELGGDVLAAQRQRLLAVDEDRRRRRPAGPRQADADVGVLALARAVDDAANHRALHLL